MPQDLPPALDGETEREYAWRIFPNDARELLLEPVARSTRCGQELCQAPIWWGVSSVKNVRTPFDIKPDGTRTGTNHWRTCRDRPEKRSNKA